MEIRILATTSSIDINTKESFNKLSGRLAGICYMPNSYSELENELEEKTLKRANNTKLYGHHSVFEHEYITLYIENVPKLFAMMLNNEKTFVTSEKSARYTKMEMFGTEKDLYDKWNEIMYAKIAKKYGHNDYFTESRIKKLAQENARYFVSVFAPTSLAYTTSYRQLNYLYQWLKNIDKTENILQKRLIDTSQQFCSQLEDLDLIDYDLSKGGDGREFSLFGKRTRNEYFGEIYCTNYSGSFASLAQAQRHRTLSYELTFLDTPQYFVPPIIADDESLKEYWLADMEKVKGDYPQGMLVKINERGLPENFLLKAKERLCTCAQLEIMQQTKETLQKYISNTDNIEIKNLLSKINTGARCSFGYKCLMPCKFKEGILLTRKI